MSKHADKIASTPQSSAGAYGRIIRSDVSPSRRIDFIAPVLIGLLAFVAVTGGAIIWPGNIAWLDDGDMRQHFLGWVFFRQGAWQFPLGLNPGFGLELSSAVAFSDSLPLLAIPFKVLSPVLPDVFQYFGLWVLVCFVLQGVFGWALAGLITRDPLARAAMTGFLVIAPPMLWRLHGHLSLFSHFLILAALLLSWRSRQRHQGLLFGLLVVSAAAVHAYLLALVAAIWLATLADGIWARRVPLWRAVGEVAFTIAATAFVCWQAGYFSVGEGVASGGYGLYRMNLLSLVDSDGWSYVLRDIAGGPGDYEGFNFLGIGLLLLAVPALFGAWGARAHAARALVRAPFSALLLLALTLFAVTNVVGLGPFGVTIPLPDSLQRLADIFRSSGRMFWPVWYVLALVVLALSLRALGPHRARVALAAALAVQIFDTSAGWTFRHRLTAEPAERFATPMRDPFWDEAASRYATVRWMMPMNHSPQWSAIAEYAARNGLTTDATFLARIGTGPLNAAREAAIERLDVGAFASDTLYLLDAESARTAVETAAAADMLATIDGFSVLAPGWRNCETCRQDYALDTAGLYGALLSDEDISLAGSSGEPYRTGGWGVPEDWGVWSAADQASIGFAEPLPTRFRLVIEAQAFGPNVDEPFMFSAGAEPTLVRIEAERRPLAFEMQAAPGARTIEITIPLAISPRELGINEDVRRLGIGVSRFRIEPQSSR